MWHVFVHFIHIIFHRTQHDQKIFETGKLIFSSLLSGRSISNSEVNSLCNLPPIHTKSTIQSMSFIFHIQIYLFADNFFPQPKDKARMHKKLRWEQKNSRVHSLFIVKEYKKGGDFSLEFFLHIKLLHSCVTCIKKRNTTRQQWICV